MLITPTQYIDLRRRLSVVFPSNDADNWLNAPQPLLGDRIPVNCPYGDVLRAIQQLVGT